MFKALLTSFVSLLLVASLASGAPPVYSHVVSAPNHCLPGTKPIKSDNGGPYWVPANDLSIRDGQPDEAQSRKVLRALDPGTPVYINIESWPRCNGNSAAEELFGLANYIRIACWAREENPTLKFGFWNVPGTTGYVNHKNKNQWRNYWLKSFERYSPLSELVDFAFVSCYGGTDLVKWQYENSRNIAAYKKWAKGKPLYAFISPRVNGRAADGLIPADKFRSQIEWLDGRVDGVVIWDDSREKLPQGYWDAVLKPKLPELHN